jgi:hypothetical protein
MTRTEKGIRDDDYELVSLSKSGDIDAFEELVRKHQKKMLNIAYRMLGNYEEACEIVQDAFLSVTFFHLAVRDSHEPFKKPAEADTCSEQI